MNTSFAPTKEFWSGRRVFITGHTGFKGTWLSLWLSLLGAKVKGFALEPSTNPSMYAYLNCDEKFDSVIANILNTQILKEEMTQFAPDVVFHLAAQALVVDSYRQPFETFETNTLGTTSVLEACRSCPSLRAIVAVATDKVYENRESMNAFTEDDSLGGKDPYSASKAAAELVVGAYRESFFRPGGVRLASARAGNVFGGGDWSENRIVPDAARSFSRGETLMVRNPSAVRPWQFVLEPLLGYLMLARACFESTAYDTALNFGPDSASVCTVAALADELVRIWGDSADWREVVEPKESFAEAKVLLLNSNKAQQMLGWKPVLSLDEALQQTLDWYKLFKSGSSADLMKLTEKQLDHYSSFLQ